MNTFKYVDLFIQGKDKQEYELIQSPVASFIGTKVVMKETPSGAIVMKEHGTYPSDDSKTLVTPFGAITGGLFKRINEYDEIKLSEAMQYLEDEHPVYLKHRGQYEEITKRAYLDSAYDIFDFEDLMEAKFYIKN